MVQEYTTPTEKVPPLPKVTGYKILDELGRGSMGVVYRAIDSKLKREVALKLIIAGQHASNQDPTQDIDKNHYATSSLTSWNETCYVKITDFGIAKSLDDNTLLTQTGMLLGTPAFMAPEQLDMKQAVSPATDVHALGALLYWLLSGKSPFSGKDILQTIKQLRNNDTLLYYMCI